MPPSCRWCARPVLRTMTVEDADGVPRRMALCGRHVEAVATARYSTPEAERRQRRLAEVEAWQRTFREPAPFGSLGERPSTLTD